MFALVFIHGGSDWSTERVRKRCPTEWQAWNASTWRALLQHVSMAPRRPSRPAKVLQPLTSGHVLPFQGCWRKFCHGKSFARGGYTHVADSTRVGHCRSLEWLVSWIEVAAFKVSPRQARKQRYIVARSGLRSGMVQRGDVVNGSAGEGWLCRKRWEHIALVPKAGRMIHGYSNVVREYRKIQGNERRKVRWFRNCTNVTLLLPYR